MKLSIVIPCYEMNGRGVKFLRRVLDSISIQSFTDYEIIVCDNSDGFILENVCNSYCDITVRHIKNKQKGAAANFNKGIEMSNGTLIRFIAQDDFLAHEDALKESVEAFEGQWLIVGCSNNPQPKWTGDIHQGNNRLGGPSCLTIKNESPMLFDETLSWMFDCEFYKRMYDKYGEPVILDGVNVNIGMGEHQLTSILTDDTKDAEVMKIRNKYDKRHI